MEDLEKCFEQTLNKYSLKLVNSPPDLSQFLLKVEPVLKKLPHGFVRQSTDSTQVIGKKKRFTLWLIHKLLWLRSNKFPDQYQIHQNVMRCLGVILDITGSDDPVLSRAICQQLLIFLHDCSEAADALFVDDEQKSNVDSVQIKAFACQDKTDPDDNYATNGSYYVFEDPLDIESMQCHVIECLISIGHRISLDLIVKGFWPLLIHLTNVGEDIQLKNASMKLLLKFLENDCLPQNSKIMAQFITLVFDTLTWQFIEEPVIKSVLQSLRKQASQDPILALLIHHATIGLWDKVVRHQSWNDFNIFSEEINPFIVKMLQNVDVESVSKIAKAEEIWAQLVLQDLNRSPAFLTELEKVTKMKQGLKTERLVPVKILEESPIFHNLLVKLKFDGNEGIGLLSMVTKVACKVMILGMEMDFLSRPIVTEAIEYLVQLVIANPDQYVHVLKVIHRIIVSQPKETLTNSSLHQIIALATIHELGNEVKSDLRLSETLKHNLIRIGELIMPQNLAMNVMSKIMKDIAPKWRCSVVKKLFNYDLSLDFLPMFIHQFGPHCLSLIKDIVFEFKNAQNLAQISGQLICSLFKTTSIKKKFTENEDIIDEILDCKVCKHGENGQENEDIQQFVMELFQRLVGHEDNGVKKLAVIYLLEPMSCHGLINQGCASLWLHCLDLGSEEIDCEFSKRIQLLLKDNNPDIEDVIIERLTEVKEQSDLDSDVVLKSLCKCIKNLSLVKETSTSFQQRLFDMAFDLITETKTHVTSFMIMSKEVKNLMLANLKHSTVKLAQRMTLKHPKDVIYEIMLVYNYDNISKFLVRQLPLLMTNLVFLSAHEGHDVKRALDFIAQQLDIKVKRLIADHFPIIFPKLVTQVNDTSQYQACINFVEDTLKMTIKELIQGQRKQIITELLMQFHANPKRVKTGFSFIAKNDEDFKRKDIKSMKDSDLAKYIQPRFLGVLNAFDQKLKDEWSVNVEDKIEILSSLTELIKLLEPHFIASVKHKILSTLNTGLSIKNVPRLVLLATWEAFITSIDINALNPILAQVIACLLQFDDPSDRKQVIKLCHFLLVKNRAALKDSFAQLNFIPEDDFGQINKIIRAENAIDENTEFKVILKLVTNSLVNENNNVKIFTLQKILALLKLNQDKLQGLILSNEETDPFISFLILKLMECCRNSDTKVSSLAGACLGKIGAVDPGRLHLVEDLNQGTCKTHLSVLNTDFMLELIHVLVRAFLSFFNSSAADSCSLSIQEVLKAYGITDEKSKLLSRLPESTREVLLPLIKSHYSLENESVDSCNLPIYQSSQDFGRWISTWSSYLMTKIKNQPEILKIFQACKAVIKKDTTCAQFLLPYILICVICYGSAKDKQEIILEIEAIIGSDDGEDQEKVKQVACLNGSILVEQNAHSVSQDLGWMAKQTVFAVFDHFNKWLCRKYAEIQTTLTTRRRNQDYESELNKDVEYVAVQSFVKSIKQHNLALASFECRAYARSLMHLEAHLRDKPKDLPLFLTKLQHVYGALDEPDYLHGLACCRKENPSLEELIHHHQVTGNFQDALACYSSLGREKKGSLELKSGMLRCYLEMDQPSTTSMLVKGLLEDNPDESNDLIKYQIESAWNLSQWSQVEEACKQTQSSDWSTNLGRSLLLVHKNDIAGLHDQVAKMRKDLMIPVSAAAMEQGAYRRCYDYLIKLQVLDEIHTISTLDLTDEETIGKVFDEWATRLKFSQYSLSTLEPVLKVRRALLDIMVNKATNSRIKFKLQTELSECWLMSAKVARKSGQLNKAYNLLLEAKKFSNKEVFVEIAKMSWARDSKSEAIDTLEKAINDQYPAFASGSKFERNDVQAKLNEQDLPVCGKAKLLLARYVDESASLDPDNVISYYNEAKMVLKNSEDALYFSGRFFDKCIGKNYQVSELDGKGDYVFTVIMHYVKSLVFGCNHLHQSLPRLMSLWLDYGSRVASVKTKDKKLIMDMTKSLEKMNQLMERFMEKAPTFYFLCILPQLTSRICHAQPGVWSILRGILINTFLAFPHHVFWHMVALSKSSYPQRAQRCKEIFDHVKTKLKNRFIDDSLSFSDQLHKICEAKLDFGEMSLREVCPSLIKLIASKGFSSLMFPTTANMTVMLPTASLMNHQPFPGELVYMSGVEETITVMKSLVRPKKVTFRGTDGKLYSFLCKPQDDLRRDCRLLDFNNLLNKLFMKDPESRKRNLHIRTYTVIPLNESNGIIEWVNNLTPFRVILHKLYKEKLGSKMMKPEDLRPYVVVKDAVEDNKKKYFALLQRHPSVFAEWFVRHFPDPQAWFMARLAYTRTTAVMSMVGYLLGLGDRHGENLLVDASTGDTVHVDLNCIFDKGKNLKIPEVVPFRLTHNMVQAMGPTGTEGPFKIACEVALGLMRNQKDVLMSALRPFYFDPLLDWLQEGKHKKSDSGEVINATAVETLQGIEAKLNGLIEKRKKSNINLPLSVAGQVRHLIQEATSHDNLSQMYLGWAPYL